MEGNPKPILKQVGMFAFLFKTSFNNNDFKFVIFVGTINKKQTSLYVAGFIN